MTVSLVVGGAVWIEVFGGCFYADEVFRLVRAEQLVTRRLGWNAPCPIWVRFL